MFLYVLESQAGCSVAAILHRVAYAQTSFRGAGTRKPRSQLPGYLAVSPAKPTSLYWRYQRHLIPILIYVGYSRSHPGDQFWLISNRQVRPNDDRSHPIEWDATLLPRNSIHEKGPCRDPFNCMARLEGVELANQMAW